MLAVTLVPVRRWVAREGEGGGRGGVWARAVPGTVGLHTGKIDANSTNCAWATLAGGKEDAHGEAQVPAHARGPQSPPAPVPAPLWRFAAGSGYSLSRQGSQTVWLTPQGCTIPSPRLQALQHSPLVVYILVGHSSSEPRVGPWGSKGSREVTPGVGPSLPGRVGERVASRQRPALGGCPVSGLEGAHGLNTGLGRNDFPT